MQTQSNTHDFLKIAVRDSEYRAIREYLYDESGIELGDGKREMVAGRLRKRLRHYNLDSFSAYFEMATDPKNPEEQQEMLDLLTTNETYFFREVDHYKFLVSSILPNHPKGQMFRVWSAASSSGEEAYGLAMELAEHLGNAPWEVFGSDISSRVVKHAQAGQYAMQRIEGISKTYLQNYCLKGTGENDGTLLVQPNIRSRVSFRVINLKEALPDIGKYEVVFLRNILIYFDTATKSDIVQRVMTVLKPGGYLMIGHSETLKNMDSDLGLDLVAPTLYKKR
ncbi:MAG: protein-glutamate O-methyltransferase CheR [Pseudomonadales bacterium]|nr:protein-glutamate O-methyltransferase CheR [Pseudomonadales bacterium]